MKIYIDCESPILTKTLNIYLKDFLSPKNEADFVISDEKKDFQKGVFLINKNSPYIHHPFTKDSLILALQEYFFELKNHQNTPSVEEQISNLIDDFKQNLLELLRQKNG